MVALWLGERIFYHQHHFLTLKFLQLPLVRHCESNSSVGEKEFFDMLESTLETTPVERLVK